jgi:amino acid adenylation domain-containing protein
LRTMPLLHDFLRRSAESQPDAIAIDCGGERITYGELFARASAIAAAFGRRSIGRGDLVVVWMRKSVDVVAVYFGALLVGAAYAPVNADAPAPYVGLLAKNGDARLIVVDGDRPLDPSGPAAPGHPAVSATELANEGGPAPTLRKPIDTDVAYVHFTSGSTGRPKGVAITHRASRAYLDICDDILNGGRTDIILNHAPLSFDLASFDIHLAVRWGAKLRLLRPEETIAPGSFLRIFVEEKPTLLYTVPTALHHLSTFPSIADLQVPSMRALLFAGEPPNAVALRKLRPVFPNATFHHWYGSTEAALVTAMPFAPGLELPERFPLGDVVGNVDVALRTEEGTIVDIAPGAAGELLVDSTLLFSGYYGDESVTAGAFVPRLRAGVPPGRWFCTRDLVRVDDGGTLHYQGRIDHMVKIRGFRVDLEEVTMALRRHPSVENGIVIARHGDRAGGTSLYGFVTGTSVVPQVVRDFVAASLPRYMVPAAIFRLDGDLPTTATGKVDLRRLGALLDVHLDPARTKAS